MASPATAKAFHPRGAVASAVLPSPQRKTPASKFINSLESPEHTLTPNTTASTPSPSYSPPPSKGQFYAIRKGRGVQHCIFSTWAHAKEHVGNYKEAVYNVFDKMEDALLYIHPPSKTSTSTINNAGNLNRKRAAVLPCSSSTLNTKKPRTVSIIQSAMLAPRKVSLSTGEADKENLGPVVSVQATKASSHFTTVKPVVEDADDGPIEDQRSLPSILEEGYKNNYVKGWRANALFPQKKQCREKWEKRYLEDVNSLKEFRGTKNTSVRDVHNTRHVSGIPNAFSLAYLNWSWGVGEAYHRFLNFSRRRQKPTGTRQRMKNNKLKTNLPNKPTTTNSRSTCVITNREAARKRFTCKAMFYSFRVQQYMEMGGSRPTKDDLPNRPVSNELHHKSPLVNGCSRSKEWMDQARADWDTLPAEDKAFWEDQERLHDEKQPEILSILEAALARDPKRSAKKLSEDIGFWCGKTTIGKWKNLRIGPSYRKGISNPASREDMTNLDYEEEEEEVGEECSAFAKVKVHTAHRQKPYPAACHSSSKKAVMEARMQEEDMII